jgi:hypothetical protein
MTDPGQIRLESLRLQLQEAISTFQLQTSMMAQAFGFIIAADALLLGYGFSEREAGILLVASFMPLALLFVYIEILNHAAPVAYVAIRLEKILLPGELTLAATYAATRLGAAFRLIEDIPDAANLDEVIKGLRPPRLYWLRTRASLAIYFASIAQFGLFLASLLAYNYRFM